MAIKLRNVDSINRAIQAEHKSWVSENAPSTLDRSKITENQYSILDYPELWSGARLFETKIEKAGKGSPANEQIEELIKKAKKENKKDPEKLKEIDAFEKKYTKYLNSLKERCLLQTIKQILDEELAAPKDPKAKDEFMRIQKDFNETLNTSSLLNMQTRQDCLVAHRKITELSYSLKNKVGEDQHEKVELLSVLSKRLLDVHYEGAKKMTMTEAISGDLASTTSFIGLATGIPAAILAIIGIAVPVLAPVLLPISGILGSISFISYTATAVSAVKMANEAIKYGRGPSPGDVKWMVIDIVLSPLYIFGGQIFAGIANLVRPLKHGFFVANLIGNLWNNAGSNVFPDIIDTAEVGKDMLSVGSIHTAKGMLKNTQSATSWNKMRGALAAHHDDAHEKVSQVKEEISRLNKSKPRPSLSKEQNGDYQELKELAIQIADKPLMKEIELALADYFKLQDNLDHEKFVTPEKYEREIYSLDQALDKVERACEQFNKAHKDGPLHELSKKIHDLTTKMDVHHIDNYIEFNNSISQNSVTALNGRDFAYTIVNKDGKANSSLAVTKSFHAHILLWKNGFIGTGTSKEAQNIIDAVGDYEQLKPDERADKRVDTLLQIQHHCNRYLTVYEGDKSKGRYNYVDNLARNVQKELAVLLDFVSSAEKAEQAIPVLVGFKAP
ncbi:hypothetical protein BN59_02745 [Legionella massiliensis]|uniref:Uncharacterized protein n=1 Tax=Legionella massiliensis TaxID=1034943 RepID=A0A078KVK1_9GAMM|nr:hypothetical protein [Legionella massiliensis]CDZ78435.1 hypothetical protein BN59_02745 [Legionella massiliensis]CEE14173.1 hypothetical protein BN1094_02745 [Legionella massiliensis]